MKSGVLVAANKAADITKAVRLLTGTDVLVGIPKGGERDSGGENGADAPTNAELGYIHEYGSPKRNIPARPFLLPGIRAAHAKIVDQLRDAGRKALQGDHAGAAKALERAGILGMNAVRAHFVDNDWPALAEATLKKRTPAQRDDDGNIVKRGKSREESGRTDPLQVTKQLRKAVTYVVRKK